MITTAALTLAEAYEASNSEDYEPNVGTLLVLALFMWFDYITIRMVAMGV